MYMGVHCDVCCMLRRRNLCAGMLFVRARAMDRAQGRALNADLGLPGLRVSGALT